MELEGKKEWPKPEVLSSQLNKKFLGGKERERGAKKKLQKVENLMPQPQLKAKPVRRKFLSDPLVVEYLERALRLAGLQLLNLITLDKKKRTPGFKKNRFIYCLVCFYELINVASEIVLIAACYVTSRLFHTGSLPMSVLMFFSILPLTYQIYLSVLHVCLLRRDEVTFTLQSILSVASHIDDSYGLVSTRAEELADLKMVNNLCFILNIYYFLLWSALFAFNVFLPIVYFNEGVLMCWETFLILESVIGFKLPWSLKLLLATGILAGYIFNGVMVCVVTHAAAVSVVIHGYYCVYILGKKIGTHKNSEILQRKNLKHPKNAVGIYTAIYISVMTGSSCFSGVLAYGMSVALAGCSFSLYLALSHISTPLLDRLLSLGMTLFLGIYATIVLQILGKYHSLSSELIKTWNFLYTARGIVPANKYGKIEQRKFKALLPIRIYAGDAYIFTHESPLFFWATMVSKCIELLYLHPLGTR